jgi:signal transduction histidine kinase
LLFSVLIFLTASALLYFILAAIINEEINEKLSVNIERIRQEIEKGKLPHQLYPIIEVKELKNSSISALVVKDTLLYDPVENENELFREVSAIEIINNKKYYITVRSSLIEAHDILEAIGLSISIVFVIMLIGLFLINVRISKNLWRPFYYNLEILKNFSIHENISIELKSSNITEFKELNESIKKLTDKVRSDYHNLKEFTENASHEIQTPLAIIQSKLELLIQIPEMSEEQAQYIHTILSATHRLSKLNQTLILLAKINNLQFPECELINLSDIIEKQLVSCHDFIAAESITVEKNLEEITITANKILVETLISNIINNAIKHNLENGEIRIDLKENKLIVSNTGQPLTIAPEKLFERFYKADMASDTLGLGLPIVKKICETNHWKVTYNNNNQWHILRIEF